MEIDVGLDAVGLPYEVEAQVAIEAARLGYGRIWTGSIGDPFQTCALRWSASRQARPEGIGTAIGVLPIGMRSPADLALSAAALSQLTHDRFVFGIGAGNVYESNYRRTWGIAEATPLALVRAHLTMLRGFLRGDSVSYDGQGFHYDNARLATQPSSTPLYLGVVGPQMTKLGGALADGIYLSWCTRESVASARECMNEGAERAGRDSSEVTLAASVRVCIDDDVNAARVALARALLPYVVGWGGAPPRPFREAFERMGFGSEIAEIDRLSANGSERKQIAEAFPERMLNALGYYGRAEGAPAAIRRQVQGADTAVVRVVAARQGLDAILAVLQACRHGERADR